jgi:hypothetical protein
MTSEINEVQLKQKRSLCGQGPSKRGEDPKDGVESRGRLAALVTQAWRLYR